MSIPKRNELLTKSLNERLNTKIQLGITTQIELENQLNAIGVNYISMPFDELYKRQFVPLIINTCECDTAIEFTLTRKQRFWLIFYTDLIDVIRVYIKDGIVKDINIDTHEKEPL